jgi:hypothetical protein
MVQAYHTLATVTYGSKEQAFRQHIVAPEGIASYPYKERNRNDETHAARRTSTLNLICVANSKPLTFTYRGSTRSLLPLPGRTNPD